MWNILLIVVFLLIVYLYIKTLPPSPITSNEDHNLQSVPVNPKEPHGARRNPLHVKWTAGYFENVSTLYDNFMRGVKISGNRPFLGFRNRTKEGEPFEWITYNEVHERVLNLGSALCHHGLEPEKKEVRVGVYARNRPEWVILEQAVNAYSMQLVPLYDTLGPEACQYIIDQAEIAAVGVDGDKLGPLAKSLTENKTVKIVVVFDEKYDESQWQAIKARGIQIYLLSELEQVGKKHRRDVIPPQPDQVATICYTSGTTGNPKGAQLTHLNLISNSHSIFYRFAECKNIDPVSQDDVSLSYLPLAHMFERLVQCLLIGSGAQIGFFRGDVKLLLADVTELRPTIFPSVPRLWNRIYDKILAGVRAKGKLAQKLFELGLAAKKREVQQSIYRKNSIWDLLVFKKVQMALGGRVRFGLTGAAPISDECLTFLRCALGCPLLEGYGQTEATAGLTTSIPTDSSSGHVGAILSCSYVKLVDVPDMKYFASEGKGEVCARGTNIMTGYLKLPEVTAEAIDSDGWLHTGDIGMWLPNGALKIIDRKKSIFKLAQGEYIAPEKIEQIYTRSEAIVHCFVYGNSLKSCLVGIVVPDPEAIQGWLAKNVPDAVGLSQVELCQNPRVQAAILEDMTKIGKAAGLQSFEQVRSIQLHPEPFSLENGLLTPTQKSKRPELQKRFQAYIDSMYATLGE